ncbi:aldo/keto reductase [Bacillus testis]|uniref:aldo/keto reductase n=1 Tax=Bacillus testis TaxID=1622072 RepID=UPI00067ECABD|nr:aldo/keto reductase [Bacillus testis]
MYTSLQDTTTLQNGVKMPVFGLGVYKMEGAEAKESVRHALDEGYRAIDTASMYKNEKEVGEAIKECKVPREDLFVTTKVWNSDQGYEETLAAFNKSLNALGLDYLDLYLIHWPVKGKYKETWKAMEKLYQDGKVKAIGVCNFQPHHLEDLMQDAKVMPMVNQVELHPLLSQKKVRDYCEKHHIKVIAWSPLARGLVLDHPTLKEIAEKHGKSTAQIVLRWELQNNVVVIPKSSNKERIITNSEVFDFELSAEEMQAIDRMNKNERTGPDPDNVNF